LSFKAHLHLVASGLEAPVGLEVANDGSNRLFVVEQKGTIRIIRDGKVLPEPFLDVSGRLDKLNPMYSEKGLLGLAFHPNYKINGRFFVYYSAPANKKGINHRSILSEFRVSANPDRALTQERILLEVPQPESNHNGGQLAFGPDGYLYIGLGDGGGAGDKHGAIGNAQNLTNLLGKILRIDVDTAQGYRIPPDNPFIGTRARHEIWAYGLRNPWRFSFDRQTGELFCGDVGQNEYEEVNLIKKGRNYGWRLMEGLECFNPPTDCNKSRLEPPLAVYSHSEGRSITGGFVYRGKQSPAWQGKYVFGDWTGKIFMLSKSAATGTWQRYSVTLASNEKDLYINSFGQDESGELYVVGQQGVGPGKKGSVWRLELL
ncbi:MAG: PQQ-dependent sugar dehydrogenase, partial [Chitinophagales bacterium]|nr:PQQ-dependent sugar dehydrogenase [Chitinophagales bacterium]